MQGSLNGELLETGRLLAGLSQLLHTQPNKQSRTLKKCTISKSSFKRNLEEWKGFL